MATTVHHTDALNNVAPLLNDLRHSLGRLRAELDALDATDARTLDVARYTRLAEYAMWHAHHHAANDESTSDPTFGFLYTALALLEPPTSTDYNDPNEYNDLAFDAIRAITEHTR